MPDPTPEELKAACERWRNLYDVRPSSQRDNDALNIAHSLLARLEAPELEICICAAYLTTAGRIFRGNRHHDIIRTMCHYGIDKSLHGESGFITSRNRFVGRKEAFILQNKAGIPSVSEGGYRGNELYSEDLY